MRQAESAHWHPGLRTSLRVLDHMSERVEGVEATARIPAVADLLARRRISCAVVLDEKGPAGIISERDLVRLIATDPDGWSERTARDVMTSPLVVISPDASVVEASGELARCGIRRLPVVGPAGDLCGLVTQTDLLRASKQRLEEYAADLERLVAERTTQLHESEERRNEIVDLTVHDMKNWLQTVEAALEIMDRNPADAKAVLPLIGHATSRVRSLLRALLDVNRLEAGLMPLRFIEIPWSTLCQPIAAEAAVRARTRSLTIVQTGESHVIVRCDPELIERVLLNLLDNAINAAPPGTSIDIHTERLADGAFRGRVGNRGQVIPPEVLPMLFRPYQQGSTGDSLMRFGGWGLGLRFCQLAVQHHGGTISVISPYVDGKGTAFQFVLPRDLEPATVRLASAPPAVEA